MIKDRNIKVEIDSLKEFYQECDIIENENIKFNSNPDMFMDTFDFKSYRILADYDWVGEKEDIILKSKFCYTKGLDKLEKIDDIILGGSKNITKWSDDDGDEMSFDRLIDGLPSMKQRIRSNGNMHGRFVTIHIGISENCSVSNEQMMNKAYACMRIIDMFESMNYRVRVLVKWGVRDLGYMQENDRIEKLFLSIVVKDFNEPLVKPTILASISTWMLRYHIFKFAGNKFKCDDSMGVAIRNIKKDTLHNIYIDKGDCLQEDSVNDKIKSIRDLLEEAGA